VKEYEKELMHQHDSHEGKLKEQQDEFDDE
jgi:hypothetical protein